MILYFTLVVYIIQSYYTLCRILDFENFCLFFKNLTRKIRKYFEILLHNV